MGRAGTLATRRANGGGPLVVVTSEAYYTEFAFSSMVALNEKLMGRPGDDIRSTIDDELRKWSALCSWFAGFGVVACAASLALYAVSCIPCLSSE